MSFVDVLKKAGNISKKVFDFTLEELMKLAKEQQKELEDFQRIEERYRNNSAKDLRDTYKDEDRLYKNRLAARKVYQEKVQEYENRYENYDLSSLKIIIKNKNKNEFERVAARNVYKRKKES